MLDDLVLGFFDPLRSLSFCGHIHLYPIYKENFHLVKHRKRIALITDMNNREFPLYVLKKLLTISELLWYKLLPLMMSL